MKSKPLRANSAAALRKRSPNPKPVDPAVMPKGLRTIHTVVRVPFLGLLRVQINGVDNVPDHGGCLLAANHRSFLDHFLLAATTPRPIRFVGKDSLTQGLSGKFYTAMGMIPVRRGAADTEMMEAAMKVLKGGMPIGIFPEGTKSRSGELYRFRSGMARLAVECGVPIIPVGIKNSWKIWPTDDEMPQLVIPPRGLVEVTYGQPVVVESNNPRARRAATNEVHARVALACAQPLNGSYAPVTT